MNNTEEQIDKEEQIEKMVRDRAKGNHDFLRIENYPELVVNDFKYFLNCFKRKKEKIEVDVDWDGRVHIEVTNKDGYYVVQFDALGNYDHMWCSYEFDLKEEKDYIKNRDKNIQKQINKIDDASTELFDLINTE